MGRWVGGSVGRWVGGSVGRWVVGSLGALPQILLSYLFVSLLHLRASLILPSLLSFSLSFVALSLRSSLSSPIRLLWLDGGLR